MLDHTQQLTTLRRCEVCKYLFERRTRFGVDRRVISQQSGELVKDLLLQRMPDDTGFGST